MNRQKLNAALRSIDQNHHSINRGGCAHMAVLLAKELEGYLEDMRITSVASEGVLDIDEARNNLYANNTDAWSELGIGFKHVWIEGTIDSSHVAIDSTGVHEAEFTHELWGSPCNGSFTIEEMEELSNEETGWNTWFDRGQLPSIKALVKSTVREAIREC